MDYKLPVRRVLFIAFSSWALLTCHAQGFLNLNFESANVTGPDFLGRIPFANAFPNWQSDFPGGSLAYYNTPDLDQMTIGIYDANSTFYQPHPVFGTYTAYLEGDLGSQFTTTGNANLRQTAVVPATAKSIRFVTTTYSSLPNRLPTLAFSVNGTPVPYSQLQVSPNGVQWVADVSQYAGLSSTIGFALQESYGPSPTHWIFSVGLDNISFSSTPVPEPQPMFLLLAGVACLCVRMCSRHEIEVAN